MNDELKEIRYALIWNWKTLSRNERQILLLELYKHFGTLNKVSAFMNHQISRNTIDTYLKGFTQSHGGRRLTIRRDLDSALKKVVRGMVLGDLNSERVFSSSPFPSMKTSHPKTQVEEVR